MSVIFYLIQINFDIRTRGQETIAAAAFVANVANVTNVALLANADTDDDWLLIVGGTENGRSIVSNSWVSSS